MKITVLVLYHCCIWGWNKEELIHSGALSYMTLLSLNLNSAGPSSLMKFLFPCAAVVVVVASVGFMFSWSVKLKLLLLLSLKGSLSSIHSFMKIADNRHTPQDQMRLWPHGDTLVKSFRSAFIVPLRSPVSPPNIVRLTCSRPQQTGWKWAPDGKATFPSLFWALAPTTEHVTSYHLWTALEFPPECHSDLERAAVFVNSVWEARLTSDELTPPCPQAAATQLWFMHFPREDTHTHTQNTNTFHDVEWSLTINRTFALRY